MYTQIKVYFQKIIIRFHPLIKYNDLKITDIKKLPKNIIISNKSEVIDFARSKFILYKGSKIIIDAVNSGLIPIYLNFKKEISIDPLFEVNNLKVSNINQLRVIIKKFNKKDVNLTKSLKKIRMYSYNYFEKYNPQNLKKIFN